MSTQGPTPAEPQDAWLDFGQAAGLFGLSAPYFSQLVDDGALAVRAAPSGRPGVMKSELLAWRLRDRAARREALVAFAHGIDREVFG